MTQFSLFEGDFLNRQFARIGLKSNRWIDLLGRVRVLWLITWLPMAAIALVEGFDPSKPTAMNFFADFAAYFQFLLGLPLFIAAEKSISRHTREAGRSFLSHSLISETNKIELEKIHLFFGRMRRSGWSDLVCFLLGLLLAIFTINQQRYDSVDTWHAIGATAPQSFTALGLYSMLIALPILNYWWLRWIWKISLWCWYLAKVSRFKLHLVASHPDDTGGLGFLSDVQSKFALVILAYGVSNVAATAGHKVLVEGASWGIPTVWCPIVGFVILAPVLFTLPLFMFTKQLSRTKRRALARYESGAMVRATAFDEKLRRACSTGDLSVLSGDELSALNNLNAAFDRVKSMRVVPFDLRSFGELVVSAIGPVLPILPYFDILPEPIVKSIEQLLKIFH